MRLGKTLKIKRAISPVIGTVLILALIIAASAMVAVFFNDIKIPDFTAETEDSIITGEVNITIVDFNLTDSNMDDYNDTLFVSFSLSIESVSIYVNDVDILLPTGKLLDVENPWIITYAPSTWDSEQKGYPVQYGALNATFIVECSNTSTPLGQLKPGESFYYLIDYNYLAKVNNRITTISGSYKSGLITSLPG